MVANGGVDDATAMERLSAALILSGPLGVGKVLGIFLEPWIVALPIAAALVGMWALARSVLDAWQADLAAIAFLGPIAALVAIAGCVWMRSDTREDFARVTARFRRNGRAAT